MCGRREIHVHDEQTLGDIAMQNSTTQQKVKRYKSRLRDDVHQKYQDDLRKMTAQGWHVVSWGEIGKDVLGRLIVEAIYEK